MLRLVRKTTRPLQPYPQNYRGLEVGEESRGATVYPPLEALRRVVPGGLSTVQLLVAAALIEALLLRFVIRMGPFLPESAALDLLFSSLQILGLGAMNLALLLGAFVLLRESTKAFTASQFRRFIAGLLTVLATIVIPGESWAFPGSAGLLVSQLLLVAAIVSLFIASLSRADETRRKVYLLLLLLAFAALATFYSLKAGVALGLSLPDSTTSYFLAEALALLIALTTLFVFRPPWRPRFAAISLALAASYLVLAWVRPWMLATMVMWNWGFSLWLPAPLYAIALGFYVYTILALASQGSPGRIIAFGLFLVAWSGLKLDYTPYALIALLGYMNLAWPLTPSQRFLISRKIGSSPIW